MKRLTLAFIVVLACVPSMAQMISGSADVITIYSQNEQFYLRSIPYDDEKPSLRGKTFVYAARNTTPMYTVERGFDVIQPNALILSNDGEIIFLATTWEADENKDGMKSISVYKKGQLIRSFTESEVNGCDKKRERCELVYNNDKRVIDYEKTFAGPPSARPIFKPGVDEKERFLNEFPIFSSDDFVYLTDSKKKLHTFDLKEARFVRTDNFDDVFAEIKTKARATKIETASYAAPRFKDFPKLANGSDAAIALADHIGMQVSQIDDRQRFKVYTVELTGNITRDGRLEIEEIDIDAGLPKEKILEFFSSQKFDSRPIPAVFEKWHLRNEFFYFRNKNARQAQIEKRQERAIDQQKYQQRLTLEKIDGVYIPANLGECFVELDKKLSEVDKKEMRALPKREDMIRYHFSLGLWMRNNWGLWRGSRLQKYFRDRGVLHPDEMSSVILYHYYDWLNDQKATWKSWEETRQPHR
jgi:hypothetical protein